MLFEYALKFNTDREDPEVKRHQIRNWVNKPSDDSFVALHFATRHGNYTMLTYLVEKGEADIYIKNKFGATVMHIAAQSDQPLSLYYFYEKGVDVNIRDLKNSTPLHWACYTRSEHALNYLMSMKPNLDARDIQGFTPLHIAIPSSEKLQSTRMVKALLIKGADRKVPDN